MNDPIRRPWFKRGPGGALQRRGGVPAVPDLVWPTGVVGGAPDNAGRSARGPHKDPQEEEEEEGKNPTVAKTDLASAA